jgi:hypothetical protein
MNASMHTTRRELKLGVNVAKFGSDQEVADGFLDVL